MKLEEIINSSVYGIVSDSWEFETECEEPKRCLFALNVN